MQANEAALREADAVFGKGDVEGFHMERSDAAWT
jgi:hypothetical protein